MNFTGTENLPKEKNYAQAQKGQQEKIEQNVRQRGNEGTPKKPRHDDARRDSVVTYDLLFALEGLRE